MAVATECAERWPDGDARFTSMTKRAPGRASAARRLRLVGATPVGSKPASRSATSRRLWATISASTSATAGSDEGVERPPGRAGAERLERGPGSVPEARRKAGGPQQGTRVEGD